MVRVLSLSALILFLLTLTTCSQAGKSRFLRWYTKNISGPDLGLLARRKLLAAQQKLTQAQMREKGEGKKVQALDSNEPLPEKAMASTEKIPLIYSPPLGIQVDRPNKEPAVPTPKKAPSLMLYGKIDALWDRFDRSCQLQSCPIEGNDVIELDRSFRELIREARRSLVPGALSKARRAWVDFRLALGNMRMVQERYLSAATNYCYALRFARARGMEERALAEEKFLKAYGEAKGRYRPSELRHLSGCRRVS